MGWVTAVPSATPNFIVGSVLSPTHTSTVNGGSAAKDATLIAVHNMPINPFICTVFLPLFILF